MNSSTCGTRVGRISLHAHTACIVRIFAVPCRACLVSQLPRCLSSVFLLRVTRQLFQLIHRTGTEEEAGPGWSDTARLWGGFSGYSVFRCMNEEGAKEGRGPWMIWSLVMACLRAKLDPCGGGLPAKRSL